VRIMEKPTAIDTKLIAGLAIKTSNDRAAETIPQAWETFMGGSLANSIKNKLSDDVYALYTDFPNKGENNAGEYTFLIGVEVDSTEPSNKPSNVFPTWMEIWNRSDLDNTFVCDFEHYSSEGEIFINVGTNG